MAVQVSFTVQDVEMTVIHHTKGKLILRLGDRLDEFAPTIEFNESEIEILRRHLSAP